VEIKYKMSKYGWLISITIGLILITIAMIIKDSRSLFLVIGSYMLLTFGIFLSIFGLAEKIFK
jgi:hypothetical protein